MNNKERDKKYASINLQILEGSYKRDDLYIRKSRKK